MKGRRERGSFQGEEGAGGERRVEGRREKSHGEGGREEGTERQ